MQELLDVQYAGNALSHLRILKLALHTLLRLRSCSHTHNAIIHSPNPPFGETQTPAQCSTYPVPVAMQRGISSYNFRMHSRQLKALLALEGIPSMQHLPLYHKPADPSKGSQVLIGPTTVNMKCPSG